MKRLSEKEKGILDLVTKMIVTNEITIHEHHHSTNKIVAVQTNLQLQKVVEHIMEPTTKKEKAS